MQRLAKSLSVSQILLIAYCCVAIPFAFISHCIVAALDSHINVMLSHSEPLTHNQQPQAKQHNLERIGSKLRELEVPFTNPEINLPIPKNRSYEFENILNSRAGIIYVCASLLLFSLIVLGVITPVLQRSFGQLNSAVERLARDQLEEKIHILGPRNIREMSAGLENLRRRLIENDTHQTLFLRHISHEIKTPLTSIKEGSKLLEDEMLGPINQEQKEVAHILVKSSSALQTAIENLLNYNSAISVRKIKRRRKVDLADLVKRAIEKHLIQIRQKELELEKELHTSRAFVDEEQILTVFENLISNAVKYSPVGGKIGIRLRNNTDRKSEFSIQDEGLGVSENQREAIFDAFFVGDQAVRSTLKGTGLGLSIAKQYVEAHNGTIKLLNSRKGAAFQVILG